MTRNRKRNIQKCMMSTKIMCKRERNTDTKVKRAGRDNI